MAALRRRRHPRALAEEMEGFAVAIAARLSGVLLSILRGASNAAGERNHRRWQPMPAVRACAAAARDWIAALEVAPP
jgi:futalosine hydrolase